MNNKDPDITGLPETKQIQERAEYIRKKRQHFERIAIGNALSEIEQEAELIYTGRSFRGA